MYMVICTNPKSFFIHLIWKNYKKKFVKKTQRLTKLSKENETMLVEINYCK